MTVHRHADVFDEGVRGVGYQLDFWGSPQLAREVEARLDITESAALGLLENLKTRWPLSTADRAALGQFLAVHIVRMPAYGAFVRGIGEEAIRHVIAHDGVRLRVSKPQAAAAAAWIRDERVHADTLLRQVPRIASFLCSMNWSIVEFQQDWLITCDQPVVLLPAQPQPISPASAIPFTGIANTLEGRFTLDSRRALLLTWREPPDEPWLAGERVHACNINAALKGQALEEWFSRPGANTPVLCPPLLVERVSPIAFELFPGYSFKHAVASRRRQAAEQTIAKIVDEQTPANEMRWVRVSERRPAADAA